MGKLKPSVIQQLRRLYPEGFWEWDNYTGRWLQFSSDPSRATGPIALLREVTPYSQLIGYAENEARTVYEDENGETVPILDGRTYPL